MAYEGFDWKGYLAYAGYPENEIPENVTDEELAQIRDHWARTVYQEELAIAAQDPFLETKKEREEAARDKLLALAPEYRQAFGLKEAQPAEAAFSADEFREHVLNNPVQDAPLDYYLKTFAAKRIGKNTKYEYPYLEGLTKKDFQDLFMERNGIDPDLTTIEDIRNGNFGPAWMAQRAEEESNLPKGSAMRQGWLTFKKLTGLTTETFGDALGIEWMRNIGKGITENAIKTIEEEGYRSKYGESLVDTFKAQGPFAAAGKILEMAQENWATTGVPLALAGMSALFGIAARNPRLAAQGLAGARASLAAATSADVAMGTGAAATVGRVGASTIAKSLAFASALASGLEVGATREELEEQSKKTGKQLYDPSDPSDVVAWGLLSAALDHVGNMMTFVGGGGLVRAAKGLVQSQQTRMIGAAEAAIRQAGREAGKSWGRKVVEAMGTEGITEALQEYANIMPARNKGVEYTPKEIRDRMIDAGAVGAFMGGGMRGVQALTERKPRTQSESDTTTPQQPTQTQTPPTNVPSTPNQPPPPGFNVASNTNYAEIEGGWAAWDGYNTGYGNTKEEASQAIIDQSNKNKDTIDPANVTSTANESRVSFGNGGEIVVTGNGHKKVIGDIISLHNANDNVVNLDGTKTHNFDATTLSGLSAEALRNRIEHSGKTAIPDTRSVRKARADQVDIAINYDGEKRDSNGNVIGRRAELVLDDATRNQLAAKGYRILGSQFDNDVQKVQLYRDGQIYHIRLETNGSEVTSKVRTKKIIGHFTNLDAQVERELSEQKHRVIDVGGALKEVQNFVSISSAVRTGGTQIERTIGGLDAKFINRKALENLIKKKGGKVIKNTDRSITYELSGETLRLDLQTNGDVVVSRDGRFLGAYQFDGSDLGNGMERATYDLANDVTSVTRFSAQDVYNDLGYRRASNRRQNVLFIKDNENGDYYVIKVSNNGDVRTVMVPYDPHGFFARLEALESMRTIEDVRQVYQDQFRFGYVELVDFGGGNLGMRSRTTGLMTDDINDVKFFTSDEVDDIINNSRNSQNPVTLSNFVKIVGISQYVNSATPVARIVDWVTVDDVAGVQAFIERAKGYGAIIADYDSTNNNISVEGKAWNLPGSFNADAAGLGLPDLYGENYLNFDPDPYIDYLLNEGTSEAIEKIKKDIDKVRTATKKIFTDMGDLLTRTNSPFYSQYITKADIDIIKSALNSTSKISNSPNRIGTKAKQMRRHFYRARLLQAKLHIDTLLVNHFPNRIDIDSEVNRLQAYDPNWSNDEVRFAAAEAEEIALRLEEEFLNLREMQVSTSISRRIWNAIYPKDSGVEYGSFIERIHNQGNDFRFSRDVNAPRAERHMSLLDELRNHPFIGNGALSDLIDSGKLVLLETQQEIEDALLRERGYKPMFSELGNIQGFASNDNMRVYLSSWGIKQGDAFRVLLHEMGAHTRRFGFSEAEFQEILSGIKANSTAQTPEGRHIRHAMWRAQNAKVSPNDPHYWEEVAAYLVEDSNEYAGLGMLDTMQAWVKRWLFTNGYIDATNFHYQDFTIFSLGMLRDSRIPLRLLNGKFDYSRHQNRIYDTRKFVESYVTEDIAKQLGYSRGEVIEMVAAHLAGTYKTGNHVIGDLPDEDELMSHFPTVDADWRAFDRDDSASDLRFSRDMETAIAEARDEVLRPSLPPAGVQKDASVIYPNMGEEISNFRYSIGKKAREQYRAQLERGREDLSPEQIENILKELDKYHDAKQFKKVKAALHWTITGRIILPEDEGKVNEAIQTAENAKVDLITNLKNYESPLDFINKYKEFKPKAPAIDPSTVPEFSDPVNLGDGIITYEVQNTKEGQQAMREIINTHWGEDANPWCLLQGDGKGNLTEDSWFYWNRYNSLPKRVAFKNGKLLSFMATMKKGTSIHIAIDNARRLLLLDKYENDETIKEYNKWSTISHNIVQIDTNIHQYGANVTSYIPDINSVEFNYIAEYDESGLKGRKLYKRWLKNTQAFMDAVYKARYALITRRRIPFRNFDLWLDDFFKISYQGDVAFIVDREGNHFYTEGSSEVPKEFYLNEDDGEYRSRVEETWWDRNDKSHPDLEWAKVDPEVGRIRFSITGDVGEQDINTFSDSQIEDVITGDIRYSRVTDRNQIAEYEAELAKGRVREPLYRAMVQWEDGSLHSPMAEIIAGKTVSLYEGDWEKADEFPKLVIKTGANKGKFPLKKVGENKPVPAAYAPFLHSSLFPLNDQFYIAYKRPLVIVQMAVPASELNVPESELSESTRDLSEKRPGKTTWNAGTVASKLGGRKVMLSRYGKIEKILSDEEVAGIIAEKIREVDENIAIPINVVHKGLLRELVRKGVKIRDVAGNINSEDRAMLTGVLADIQENGVNAAYFSNESNLRFSIAQQPTTPEQGTAISNAPGMYKMRNGTIQAHPEYIPPGLETETAIYAAVAISDIAKNEPGLEDVRAMINADEVLREEVLAELSQRGIEDTRDNEFLYAIRNVLQTREPEDPTYQAIVDVFHDAITKATGGIQDDILLTDSDIAAAAHAIINTPFEPLIGDPVPTVPTPKPTVFDQMEANWAMMQSTIDEAVANAEVSERETPIIRYSIAGVDMRLDGVEGYNGVDGRQKLYAELEQIYGSTHQWNEWDSFYNQLAAAQITGTREVHDVGALAAPADSNRGLVDQFLNAALPDYLKDKIQIEWTMTPDAVKNLNGGLASFDPRGGAADKLIYIQGWNRTVGQVIRSAAWELSRFGWNAAPGAMTNLKKPLVELYNLHESAIYQELSPYYTKYKINRANVSDKHKIFLVQTYFAKMNQDILTGNPNALAQQIGIDPATYKRIHDEIVQNINTVTTDLTNYIKNYTFISTSPEIAKAFTQDILRLIMGGMHGRGAAFVYETANSAGPSDTIYCYTNDFGLHRKFVAPTDEDNRYARIANEIKQNLKWWRETFEPWGLGELAENFCRFFLRNFPMHNGLSFLHLNVPSAHLGDTTITKATSLISRIWQRVDDPHGIEIREKLKVMERIHAILRDHNYDARWTENATNGYEALFRSLGITDEKSIATAQLADRALPDLQAMIQRNAAEIRADFAMTIDSLVTHMSTSRSIPEREITNMIQRMNNYAESFLGDYEHRTYEAYSLDGLDELIAMKHDLNIDPNTGELTIHAKAAAAQKFISDTEQRLGGRNAEFYKQTEEARNIVRRASRLDSLRKYKQAKITNSHRGLTGGELDERVIKEMNDELGKLIDDVREMRTADRGIYKKFNYIPGAKRRKLDERIEADREYMNFLGRVTDPLMNAIYSIDQQKKILEKLHFNRELGEHIISSGMGEIRGDAVSSSVGEGTIKDISTLEGGTFLEYIRVYPEFQKEINAEYRINSKVRDSVLGGVIDVWKANNTIYSLRLGINNYVGNFSMLLASGHLWRFANIFQAGQITKRQFLERFTTNVNGLDATTQELYEEMRSARVVGGTMSEMNVMAYGRGVHEKVIGFFLKHLRDADVLSSQGKFVAETWVNSFLEKMKTFYAFGDEWVKPLMYLNNRANAIAKWESKLDPNAPEFGGDVTEWKKEVRRRAIEEAAEQTIRESVSWENSPQFIRWLSQKNLRIFTPDFLMHNFQMLRITASNFLRLGECFRELNALEVNNERDANYKDALVKEIAQRGVGGAMTTAVYAGLMGATGSVMALVPYMINVLFNNIEGEGDDDDKKGMFFGPDEWEGAQRLINYKTGGNNLFVPVFKSGDKIYAWNYVRSSVMLTHAPVRPPTDDPTFTDYGAVIMRNIVDLSNGTMTQQLINNMMGKDRFGREIGIVEGWGRVLERTLVPGFARQLAGVTLGYPLSDNMFHEGRAIKIPDLLGITVNAYDPRDVANHLAYDINSHNTDRNIHRRNFVEQLSKSDRLSDRQIVGMIADMRERNARDLSKANYVVTGLRQVGMTDREIVHWLTHNRKTGGDALARKHAVELLKGKDIYDEALITTLVNKRNKLNEGPQNLRMSKDELAVVNANLDKAIRMYKQALRVQ